MRLTLEVMTLQEQPAASLSFKSPLPLFRPPSIAIVGASERAKWPAGIYRNLRKHGFPGNVYPVNPRLSEIWDTRCYPDLASLPEPPSHAFVIVPAPAVQGILEAGVAAGLKSATVYAAQLGEGNDPEIVARGVALKGLIERSGLTMCGPNCMGLNAVREKNYGYPNADLCGMTPGSVAFVTQSGGTVQYIGQIGAHRGIYFNYLVSSGNELSVDLADYLNFFAEDESTRVIALFIEGIRRPQAFMAAAAKALAAGKPIVAIKTGKSQKARDSAKSHTGAIAGDYGAFTAMCERYGIVVCQTLDDMIETLLVFQAGRLPKGPRVGWITTSGGTVDLLYDYLEETRGLEAPEFSDATKTTIRPMISHELALKNPIDAGSPINDKADADLCSAIAADPNFDMVAWGWTPPSGSRVRDPSIIRSITEKTDKPVIGFIRMTTLTDQTSVKFQDEVGFPFLQGLTSVIGALGALAFYGARKGKKIAELSAPTGKAETLQGAAFDAALTRHGLTLPKSVVGELAGRGCGGRNAHRFSGRAQDRLDCHQPQDRGRRRAAQPCIAPMMSFARPPLSPTPPPRPRRARKLTASSCRRWSTASK